MHQLKRASSEGCGDAFRRGARRVTLCACANRNTTLGENRGEQSSDFASQGEAGAGHFSPKKSSQDLQKEPVEVLGHLGFLFFHLSPIQLSSALGGPVRAVSSSSPGWWLRGGQCPGHPLLQSAIQQSGSEGP